jgi:lysophospholipase L1-like esterase
MKTKMKLLSIGITIIIISLGIATFIQTMGNKIPASPIRVACVGDSITKGSGYTVKLQSLLGAAYSVANFGVDGSTVSLNSNRPYINQPECQKAEEFQPDIVVIMLGTNDANPNLTQYNDTFEDDYSKLVSSFQELESNPQIWVVKSPPIQNNSFDLSAPILTEDVIPHIENVANNLDLPTIDVYSALDNHPDYFTDGVHPDGDGATLIASTVCIAITPGEFY